MEAINPVNTVNTVNVSLSSIVRASRGSSRISVPVPASSFFIAGGLKHISVMHVPGGASKGFSVSKLRALDNLIDMLSRMGKSTEIKTKVSPQGGSPAQPGNVDSVIEGYRTELKRIMSAQKPYTPPFNLTGLLVNGLV